MAYLHLLHLLLVVCWPQPPPASGYSAKSCGPSGWGETHEHSGKLTHVGMSRVFILYISMLNLENSKDELRGLGALIAEGKFHITIPVRA